MATDTNFTFPVTELAKAIFEKLLPLITGEPNDNLEKEKYLTRKETANKLNISLPTLNEYSKRGLIHCYRLGSRILYKQSEVEAALIKIRFTDNINEEVKSHG